MLSITRPSPAFPFGGPSARENVQWTFSSEDGPVRPMEGAPQGAEEVPGRSPVNGGLPYKPELRRAPTSRSRCLVQMVCVGKPP